MDMSEHQQRMADLYNRVNDAMNDAVEELEPSNAEVVVVLDKLHDEWLQTGRNELPEPGEN